MTLRQRTGRSPAYPISDSGPQCFRRFTLRTAINESNSQSGQRQEWHCAIGGSGRCRSVRLVDVSGVSRTRAGIVGLRLWRGSTNKPHLSGPVEERSSNRLRMMGIRTYAGEKQVRLLYDPPHRWAKSVYSGPSTAYDDSASGGARKSIADAGANLALGTFSPDGICSEREH